VKTPEGKIKDVVKKVLTKHGAYYFMPVQNGYGAATLDFLCCYNGLFFAIETKAPGKKLTERQELTKASMNKAGGLVFVIDGSVQELEEFLLDNTGTWM
jgi:hypothetical protein